MKNKKADSNKSLIRNVYINIICFVKNKISNLQIEIIGFEKIPKCHFRSVKSVKKCQNLHF